MFLALVIVRTSSASPTHFSIRGTLRRQSRHYVEPYWLSPCGDVMASLSVKTKYEPLSTKAMKHHYLAIRNYAETLDRLVNSLQTKKVVMEMPFTVLTALVKAFVLAWSASRWITCRAKPQWQTHALSSLFQRKIYRRFSVRTRLSTESKSLAQ